MSQSDTVLIVTSGGMRLDQFLGDSAVLKSRSEAKALIDAGHVSLNGKRCTKASARVKAGDSIGIKFPSPPPMGASFASNVILPMLFEDDFCMVIDKPAGISVHPGHGMKAEDETILSAVKPMFSKRHLPFQASTVLVHRLDKHTTGCLLIAKTPEAHQALQSQFADRSIRKTYLALVSGIPSPAAAVIDAPIGRHKNDRTKMSVLDASSKLRTATTTYRVIGRGKNAALVACELHTGRTHQLRVHLSTIGHPILGDQTYMTRESAALSDAHGIQSICLHAWKLSFTSLKGIRVNIESPVPVFFHESADKLGIVFKDDR